MKTIIIGAGRGRRLMPATANAPKCYAEIQGRRMLDWGLHAFARAGLTDICFSGGYQIDLVRRDSAEAIASRVLQALKHLAAERITLNPDCGFAPGSGAAVSLDEAYRKLCHEAEAARRLRAEATGS